MAHHTLSYRVVTERREGKGDDRENRIKDACKYKHNGIWGIQLRVRYTDAYKILVRASSLLLFINNTVVLYCTVLLLLYSVALSYCHHAITTSYQYCL